MTTTVIPSETITITPTVKPAGPDFSTGHYRCAYDGCYATAFAGQKPASPTCGKRPDGRHMWVR